MRNLRLKTKYDDDAIFIAISIDDLWTHLYGWMGVLFAILILLSTFVFLNAFADHETRYVAMFDEPCMEEVDEYGSLKLCYVPFKVVVDAGSVVVWENIGTQVHTITSGTLVQPTAHFNSGLVAPNGFYSLEFAVEGIYPYYCMMHPWMNLSLIHI